MLRSSDDAGRGRVHTTVTLGRHAPTLIQDDLTNSSVIAVLEVHAVSRALVMLVDLDNPAVSAGLDRDSNVAGGKGGPWHMVEVIDAPPAAPAIRVSSYYSLMWFDDQIDDCAQYFSRQFGTWLAIDQTHLRAFPDGAGLE